MFHNVMTWSQCQVLEVNNALHFWKKKDKKNAETPLWLKNTNGQIESPNYCTASEFKEKESKIFLLICVESCQVNDNITSEKKKCYFCSIFSLAKNLYLLTLHPFCQPLSLEVDHIFKFRSFKLSLHKIWPVSCIYHLKLPRVACAVFSKYFWHDLL